MVAILSIVSLNLAVSLYFAYRRPTTRYSDYPAWFTLLSAVATLPIVAWAAIKGRGER